MSTESEIEQLRTSNRVLTQVRDENCMIFAAQRERINALEAQAAAFQRELNSYRDVHAAVVNHRDELQKKLTIKENELRILENRYHTGSLELRVNSLRSMLSDALSRVDDAMRVVKSLKQGDDPDDLDALAQVVQSNMDV